MSEKRSRFLSLLDTAVGAGNFRKLTLGKHRGADTSVQNLFVRPVVLKTGPCLSFVWRHATRDITKNLPQVQALEQIASLLGTDFLDAHLFTSESIVHYASPTAEGSPERLSVGKSAAPETGGNLAAASAPAHDRIKAHLIDPGSPWLEALGITNASGRPRAEMSAKFRQIQNFAALFQPLFAEAWEKTERERCDIVDMGCGKGYLTFALASLLGEKAHVLGIERQPELVAKCNTVARTHGLHNLSFEVGAIAEASIQSIGALIALHACDTATDEALARGVAARARLLVVAPCCHKELRPLLKAPQVLAPPLRHGIFLERQAEFATDALRALLLEWAGYDTRVFEFISTEHTAKNLMIAAVRSRPAGDPEAARRARSFASFYGISHQRLAALLDFQLAETSP